MDANWGALKLSAHSETLPGEKSWQIEADWHTVIVHRGGKLHGLRADVQDGPRSAGVPLPGETWLIPAGGHYHCHAWGESIDYFELHLFPEKLRQLTGRADLPARLGYRDAFLESAVHRLADPGVPRRLGEALAESIAYHLQTVEAQETTREEDWVTRVRDFIESRLDERLSLERLSAVCGWSSRRFCSEFAREFGTSPARYIVRQRVRRAGVLLAGSRQDVASIALECGFSSHSHLSSTFKRETGRTPAQYRLSR